MVYALPKTRRRIFFYGSILVFLAAAPFIILYSLGYTVDIQRRTVEETGGIFIKTNQTDFTVILNNGTVQKSSLLTRGLLLNNLTPGQYRLRVKKQGYQPWEKVVLVTQFSVREIRDIVLLPDPIAKKNIATWDAKEHFERAFVSPTGEYAGILLQNTVTQKYSLLFFKTSENKIIARFPVTAAVETIVWNEAENTALLAIRAQTHAYARITLSASPTQTAFFEKTITISGNAAGRRVTRTNIKKIRFGNKTDSFVMLTNTDLLLFWDTATANATILAEEVEEFEVLGDDVFFVAKNGFAARQSLRDAAAKNLGRKGYILSGSPIRMVRSRKGDIFLKDGAGGLFFYSRDGSEEFELIETGVADIALDGEEEKLFFRKQNGIGVLHLEDNPYQPFEKRGDKKILLQSHDTTFLDATWYTEDDAHIFLNTSGGVFLLDTDTRGGPKIAELNAKPAEKIFWNQDEKKLYLIHDAGIETVAIE